MIDLHCHYLHGVDDGARTLEEGLRLAKAAEMNGITEAVLTPHFHPPIYSWKIDDLTVVKDELEAAMKADDIRLTLHLGAEVRLSGETIDVLTEADVPLIGMLDGMGILLVEFPDGRIPVGMEEACRYLLRNGIRPLIAHPERNREVMVNVDRIAGFHAMGCLLQITAGSLLGSFGRRALSTSFELLSRNLVGAVASDSHNLLHRPPLMREARDLLRRNYGSQFAQRLTESTPGDIVAGRQLQAGARLLNDRRERL